MVCNTATAEQGLLIVNATENAILNNVEPKKENGTISLEDCEKVNNEIEEMLDTADYIKEQYFLEVSSTGIKRQNSYCI